MPRLCYHTVARAWFFFRLKSRAAHRSSCDQRLALGANNACLVPVKTRQYTVLANCRNARVYALEILAVHDMSTPPLIFRSLGLVCVVRAPFWGPSVDAAHSGRCQPTKPGVGLVPTICLIGLSNILSLDIVFLVDPTLCPVER